MVLDDAVSEYKGSEMSVALTFAKKYNLTPLFVVNEADFWGQIFPNWSGNGLLGNLVLDIADMGFGN